MKKVSQVSSKYTFTKVEAKKHLNQSGLDHITRLSSVDIVRTMPIEDLRKLFKSEVKDPIKSSEGNNVFEYEVVVSIEIEG